MLSLPEFLGDDLPLGPPLGLERATRPRGFGTSSPRTSLRSVECALAACPCLRISRPRKNSRRSRRLDKDRYRTWTAIGVRYEAMTTTTEPRREPIRSRSAPRPTRVNAADSRAPAPTFETIASAAARLGVDATSLRARCRRKRRARGRLRRRPPRRRCRRVQVRAALARPVQAVVSCKHRSVRAAENPMQKSVRRDSSNQREKRANRVNPPRDVRNLQARTRT